MFDKILPHSRNMAIATLAQWMRTERMAVHSTNTEYNFVSCEFKYVHYHFTSIECSIISLLLYRVYFFKNAIPLSNSKPQTISFSLTQSKARSKSRAKTLIRVDVELYNVHVLLNRLVVHSHFFS